MRLRYKVMLIPACLLLLLAVEVLSFRRDAWLADYQQLKADLAQGYANLDWMVAHRKLDLPALDAETTAALQSSYSRLQAWWALRRFIRAFADPHLKLAWRGAPPHSVLRSNWQEASSAPDTAQTPPPPLVQSCAEAGYENADKAFRMLITSVAGWRELTAAPFPSGVVGTTGVLRIAALGENQYLRECETVFAQAETARALQLRVRAALQKQLEATVAALRAEGIQTLVVDLTGNGGGSEWVREVIPVFTSLLMTRTAPIGLKLRCDRQPVWRGEPVCPLLDDRDEKQSLQGRGLWSGPLQIWMDGGTGSASEDFVAWYLDNQAAQLVGEKTAGAGCGYMNGGHVSVLPATGLHVRMPNCGRYLRNGQNEIEGLSPNQVEHFDAATLPRLLASR